MVVLENEKYLIEVDEMGAELSRIYSKEKDLEYMWLGDEKYWLKHSPVLFPFIGRMMDQKYLYKGKSYGMSRHGFAPISVFSIQKLSDRLVCTLNAVDRDDFPFDCTLEVSYILRCDGLDMVAKVINRSEEEMIYTYGGHPGFNVPLEKGLFFEDYYLYFPEAGKKLYRKLFGPNFLDSETKEEFFLKDGRLDLSHDLFDNDAVVLENSGSLVEIKSDKGERAVSVRYKGFPYCGFWHAMKKDAPYVCVEPWMSMPGPEGRTLVLEDKKDFIHLEAGGTNVHVLEIRLK